MGSKHTDFHTVGDLMVGVWIMAGGSSSASALQLSFSLVQPQTPDLCSLWLKLIKRQGHHAALADSESARGMS